jgi:MurNAc alpha-1-phosphate uridylyltransferase
MFPVAILSGGLATRLGAVTKTLPKSLIPIDGEPFICHQLRRLKIQGVSKVVICVGHLGQLIKDEIGDGGRFGLEILYSSDGDALLGTGGAIKKATSLLGDVFFIMYGDSFLTVDMLLVQRAFMQYQMSALMVVFKNEDKFEASNATLVGHLVSQYNKFEKVLEMKYIDYGLSVVSRKIFDDYSLEGKFDLGTVFERLSKNRELVGFETSERFYEIGSVKGLKETEKYIQMTKI